MERGLYKWIGSSTFPGTDGSAINLVYLAEKQPDGIYRPCTRRNRQGVSVPGFLVSVEVYNASMQAGFKIGDDVDPEFGANSRLLGVRAFK